MYENFEQLPESIKNVIVTTGRMIKEFYRIGGIHGYDTFNTSFNFRLNFWPTEEDWQNNNEILVKLYSLTYRVENLKDGRLLFIGDYDQF